MVRTFSFTFDSEAEAWRNCPSNAVMVSVRPVGTKFELRYAL